MRRITTVLAACGLIGLPSGCITLFSKTDVVRSEEARRAVSFESPAVAETFHEAMKKQTGTVGGAYVGVPFVTLYSRQKTLSETAIFNDAVARCDGDQNGVITQAEAEIYANAMK